MTVNKIIPTPPARIEVEDDIDFRLYYEPSTGRLYDEDESGDLIREYTGSAKEALLRAYQLS